MEQYLKCEVKDECVSGSNGSKLYVSIISIMSILILK